VVGCLIHLPRDSHAAVEERDELSLSLLQPGEVAPIESHTLSLAAPTPTA
jgi:hypothetical protein